MYFSAGIDASLTGLGLLAVPEDWARDPMRALRAPILSTDRGDGPMPARYAKLARDVVAWLRWLVRRAGSRHRVEVWIEGALTKSSDMGESARTQLELAGVLRKDIYEATGIVCRTAEQSDARKLVLGYLPAKDRKAEVIDALFELAPDWADDHYDALVAANWGAHVAGWQHIGLLADAYRRSPSVLNKEPPITSERGFPYCRECRVKECLPPRKAFCSKECVHNNSIRWNPCYARRQVGKRDKGVCALCGLDTEALALEIDGLDREARDAFLKPRGFTGKIKTLWEMDHVVPVVEGGGSCLLEGLRTLCLPCHRAVTKELRERRRQAARERFEARRRRRA